MKHLFLILFVVMTSVCVVLSVKIKSQRKKIQTIEILVEKQDALFEKQNTIISESNNKLNEILSLTKGNTVLSIDDVFVIWENGYVLGQVRAFQYVRGVNYSAKTDSINAMIKLSGLPVL